MSIGAAAPHLPIIDLSLWNDGEVWRSHVAAQLDWAAASSASFMSWVMAFTRHQWIDWLSLSRAFFDEHVSVKEEIRMTRGGRAWRGYFPMGGELTSGRPDLKEGLYFGEELSEEDTRVRSGQPLHGRNLFPEAAGFRDAVLDYMRELTGLSHALMACVGRGLHIGERYFADAVTGTPTTLFRIFNYPPDTHDVSEAQGVGEHTDYGLLTVLYQDDVGGLQVRHGSQWMDIPPVPGSLVVNVGDMLERLTSGRYISALHRVRNTSDRARLSMPFFFDPSFDAVLQPIAGVGPATARPGLLARWDGLDLREVRGTYGDYLIGKVARVFPDLARSELAARTQSSSPLTHANS